MNRKTLNLTLGAVALGLIGLVAYQQYKDAHRDEAPAKKGEPLSSVTVAAVDHVALRHPGAADILLELKAGNWLMTAPVAADADKVEVDRLIGIASGDSTGKIDLAKVNRADFGLDPARFTLTLNDDVFAFGDVERIRFLRYVEVAPGKPEDRILLIVNPDDAIVDADYTDLLSKKLLPAEAEITGVELPTLKVEKKGSVWVTEPAAKDASQDDLQRFVDNWKRAAAIRTEPPETPKGQSRNLMATISFADGSSRSYLIVNRSPQLILDYAPLKVRYRLPPDLSQTLQTLPKPEPAPAGAPEPAAKPATTPADAAAPKAEPAAADPSK